MSVDDYRRGLEDGMKLGGGAYNGLSLGMRELVSEGAVPIRESGSVMAAIGNLERGAEAKEKLVVREADRQNPLLDGSGAGI